MNLPLPCLPKTNLTPSSWVIPLIHRKKKRPEPGLWFTEIGGKPRKRSTGEVGGKVRQGLSSNEMLDHQNWKWVIEFVKKTSNHAVFVDDYSASHLVSRDSFQNAWKIWRHEAWQPCGKIAKSIWCTDSPPSRLDRSRDAWFKFKHLQWFTKA